VFPQIVPPAARYADRVRVEDMPPNVRRDLRKGDPDVPQTFVVHTRELAPARIPLVEPLELDAEDSSLDLVQPRVVADDRVVVAGRLPVLAQGAELFGEALAVRRDAPRFAICP